MWIKKSKDMQEGQTGNKQIVQEVDELFATELGELSNKLGIGYDSTQAVCDFLHDHWSEFQRYVMSEDDSVEIEDPGHPDFKGK